MMTNYVHDCVHTLHTCGYIIYIRTYIQWQSIWYRSVCVKWYSTKHLCISIGSYVYSYTVSCVYRSRVSVMGFLVYA